MVTELVCTRCVGTGNEPLDAIMGTTEFEHHVLAHAKHDLNDDYCVIAINGEAGEIAEWYKKMVLRKNIAGKMKEEDLLGELGDVLYYLTKLGLNHGWSLDKVMAHNKQKLDARVAASMRQIV